MIRPALCLSLFAAGAMAQGFTAADSGWVRIFNGNDFGGLYSRTYGASAQPVRPPAAPYQILYAGTDTAVIRVSTTTSNQQGNIGTDKTSYKHYRVRVQYRFDVANSNNNAGLTYHTDESVPRMQNNWPRSIESQMKQNETGSAFSIQQLAFNTRTTGTGQGSSYSATGNNVVLACETGCNGRWYRGAPLVGTHPSWIQKEVVVRGSDSALHIINGTTVMRLWNIRLVNNSGQTIAPVDSGGITLQAEGALINYRRWEIMEFPASTPMSEHFLHRLFLDAPSGPMLLPQEPGTITFQWRGIGTIPWVRLERKTGSAGWTLVADSLPNTGSYTWNHPGAGLSCASPACVMTQYRISGPGYVAGDSTVGRTTSLRSGKPGLRGGLTFSVSGHGEILSGLVSGSRIEIRDAGGSLVRALVLDDGSLSWDMRDARGARVPPGIYFLRALREGEAYRVGRTVVW